MGQWTHINGSIRIDSLRLIGDNEPDFKNLFKTCTYDDNYEGDLSLCNVPCGSEGSIHISIWDNPRKNYVSAYTVNIFGSLKDFGEKDIPSVKKWFKRILFDEGLDIRQAVLECHIEEHGTYVFVLIDEKLNEIIFNN